MAPKKEEAKLLNPNRRASPRRLINERPRDSGFINFEEMTKDKNMPAPFMPYAAP